MAESEAHAAAGLEAVRREGSDTVRRLGAHVKALNGRCERLEAEVATLGEEGAGRYASAPRRYELLTDLSALEEWAGEAELAMAGTAAGVTACQLSVRQCGGLPLAAVEEAIAAGRAGLDALLPALQRALPAQRAHHGPTFGSVAVPEAMLGRVIGPGGANIREVEEGPAGARVYVGQGGVVHIFAPSAAQFGLAKARVLDLAGESIKVRACDPGLLAGGGAGGRPRGRLHRRGVSCEEGALHSGSTDPAATPCVCAACRKERCTAAAWWS